jgi:hypothetical protein
LVAESLEARADDEGSESAALLGRAAAGLADDTPDVWPYRFCSARSLSMYKSSEPVTFRTAEESPREHQPQRERTKTQTKSIIDE